MDPVAFPFLHLFVFRFDLKLFYSFSCFSMCRNLKSPDLCDESWFCCLKIQNTFPVGCFKNPFILWNWWVEEAHTHYISKFPYLYFQKQIQQAYFYVLRFAFIHLTWPLIMYSFRWCHLIKGQLSILVAKDLVSVTLERLNLGAVMFSVHLYCQRGLGLLVLRIGRSVMSAPTQCPGFLKAHTAIRCSLRGRQSWGVKWSKNKKWWYPQPKPVAVSYLWNR